MAIENFREIKRLKLSEVEGVGILFEHLLTGAQILKIENNDENRVFTAGFRTPPYDSTGIAHILEHSVLAGSRKFPLRDPFFELVKGSLNTFLNAYTCPDLTIYPCASQNAQDFLNLMDVYLDAVFFPRLSFDTYQREGWHIKLKDPEGSPLYGGIVFNEMKGASSAPAYHFYKAKGQALFPDTHYAHESGGDPTCIPDLTYQALVSFHMRCYHPSNSCIFLYGAGDTTQELELLSRYLDRFSKSAPQNVKVKDRASAPTDSLIRKYPVAPNSDLTGKYWFSSLWSFGPSADPMVALEGEILSEVLCGIEGSALKKAILDAQLGESVRAEVSPYSYLTSFSCDVLGTSKEKIAKIEQTLKETIAQLAHEGVSEDLIDAAFKSVLFRYRNASNAGDRGMKLSSHLLMPWLYGGEPFTVISYEQQFETLKKQLPQLRERIQRLLIDNPHRAQVILEPDPNLDAELTAQENSRLEAIKNQLTPETRIHLFDATVRLEKASTEQDVPEILALLPRLKRSDLPIHPRLVQGISHHSNVVCHEAASHGLVYTHISFDLSAVPTHLLQYANIFTYLLFSTGTSKKSYEQFSLEVAKKTGGLSASLFIRPHGKANSVAQHVVIHGSALEEESDSLFELISEALTDGKLQDASRNLQLLKELRQGLEEGLIQGASGYASRRASVMFHPALALDEHLNGISFLEFLRTVVEQAETSPEKLGQDLEVFRSALLRRNKSNVVISTETKAAKGVQDHVSAFLSALPDGGVTSEGLVERTTYNGEGLSIPGGVYYVALSAPLFLGSAVSPGATAVAAQHVWGELLLPEIRYQGGAYGSRSSYDYDTGVFKFFSYRDPQLSRTVNVFRRSAQFLKMVDIDPAALLRSIVGVISAEERPLSVSAQGYRSLADVLTGKDDSVRVKRRAEHLATTVDEIKSLAEVLEAGMLKASVVTIGAEVGLQSEIDAANGIVTNIKKLL